MARRWDRRKPCKKRKDKRKSCYNAPRRRKASGRGRTVTSKTGRVYKRSASGRFVQVGRKKSSRGRRRR